MIIYKSEEKDFPFLLGCDMQELEDLYDLIKWCLGSPLEFEGMNRDALRHIMGRLEQVTGDRPPR